MIKFDCTKCGHSYNVSEEYAGKRVRCKECKEINTIPSVELETDSGDKCVESRKYGTTGPAIVKGRHKPIKVYATRWRVATENRGLLPCGNRAAYN